MKRGAPVALRSAAGRPRRWVLASLVVAAACASPGVGTAPADPTWPDPVLEPGGVGPGDAARAAALFRQADDAWQAGRAADAMALAGAVVERYPASGVSGRALWIQARAAAAAERWRVAGAAAVHFADLVDPGDPRYVEAQLIGVDAEARVHGPVAALERLASLRLDPSHPRWPEALATARAAASAVDPAELADLADAFGPGTPFAGVVLARHAVALQQGGQELPARATARAALEAGVEGPDQALVADVLAGAFTPIVRAVRIGSILPRSGSPALQEFARLIAEGVEVAAASPPAGLEVEVVWVDDQGDPAAAAAAVRRLAGQDVLGAVGPLEDAVFEGAAEARESAFPLVSPTARTLAGPASGAFALAGADPRSAAAVAEYAAGVGVRRFAVVHPDTPDGVEEAAAFEGRARALGLESAGRFVYPAGATYFQDQIGAARASLRIPRAQRGRDSSDVTLHPELALFLPLPPEDVELLAPQLTFFGLDTLGVTLLGTSGWTDPDVLAGVDPRHTDGVVATASLGAGPGSDGYRIFRDAYEAHFRRSLVSPIPALGYDAGLLLLRAVAAGATTPASVQRALESLSPIEGATGTFEVVQDRLVRRQELVRVEGRRLHPVR